MRCSLCLGELGPIHHAREMMHGVRTEFRYGECRSCGSLELLDVPEDLGPYYPSDYYSLRPQARASRVVRLLRRCRAELVVRGHSRLARAITRGGAELDWRDWLEFSGLDRSAAICDVGCGSGALLFALGDQGFTNLTGIDPFLEASETRDGVRLLKARAEELDETFDLVIVNHAFEHMPEPVNALNALGDLLAPNGTLILAVPVAGSWAWRHYGVDWVGLDPPRHLFVPSVAGLEAVAERAQLVIYASRFDSSGMQFWRSEQYQRDIPLFDPRSHEVDPRASGFSEAQLEEWERRAAELNARGDGDTATFYLAGRRTAHSWSE